MATNTDGIIRLDGKTTTYIIRVNGAGHLENFYYGRKLRDDAVLEGLYPKRMIGIGTGVSYTEHDPLLFLENTCLETSTPGKGDFRSPAILVEYGKGMTTLDFVYKAHRIVKGKPQIKGIPAQSYTENPDDATTLQFQLVDKKGCGIVRVLGV